MDRKKAPREMMLRNLASSVIIYEKVKTTEAKAKVVRSLVDKIVTIAKKDDLASKKRLIEIMPQPLAVRKAIEVLGKRYKDREGGYSRLVRIGSRQGDAAEIVQVELV